MELNFDIKMRLLVVAFAIILDILVGDPPNQFHPVATMGAFIRKLTLKAPQSGRCNQFFWGMFITILGLIIFSYPVYLVNSWIKFCPIIFLVLNVFLLKIVFSLNRLLKAGGEVQELLECGDLDGARTRVSWHLVSRKTEMLSLGHVSSAVIESLAENLVDSFLAPLVFYLLGGLPMAWAYRFINTADAMIGYRGEPYEYTGKFAARADDALNWIMARFAGFWIVFVSFILGFNARLSLKTMLFQHQKTESPNAGWPMAAMAGALGVTLEKKGCYELNAGTELPTTKQISQARKITAGVAGAWFVLCCGVALWI